MKASTTEEKRRILVHLFGGAYSSPDEFKAFFRLYDELSNKGVDWTPDPTFLTHDHLLQVADFLKQNSHLTRQEIHQALLEKIAAGLHVTDVELEKALNLAVQCAIMVDCSAQGSHSAGYNIGGYKPLSWEPQERYVDFVKSAIGSASQLGTGRLNIVATNKLKASLQAWKLKKRLGIKFKPTDDITKHLLLDSQRNILFIFHHVKFLKAQAGIYYPIQNHLEQGIEESLKRGTLPPQLLVETLRSVQAILFPTHKRKATKFLEKLIDNRENPFDPECVRPGGETEPDSFRYIYLAKRIANLQELLEKRPPKNAIERWLQWQSSEGNALLVAFVALLISIIVGVISIGLSAVQIWISWMAWKHPVES